MGKILRTPVYKANLRKIYAYSLRHFGEQVADETMRQIRAVEQGALNDSGFGKIDAQYHSQIFRYKTTLNSQTIFFHPLGDDIVMITAGFCARDWSVILKKLEDETMQQIKSIFPHK
jgi:plasmid stabilization system protein ParE